MRCVNAKLFGLSNHSVAMRTTCIILIVVSVIMITVGIWQMMYVRSVVAEETNRQASRSMLGAIGVMENRLSNVETAKHFVVHC